MVSGVMVEDGDDCGWWCVVKGVVFGCVVWFVVGVVYGCVVWFVVGVVGRCRDGRYAVNASRCDVWVVCARLPVCIVTCYLGF